MRSRNKILAIITAIITGTLIGNGANATNGWEIPLNGPSTTTSQTSSSVSLSLSSGTIQTNLDAANASSNPDEAGKVLSQTATITVGNTDGYTVYVSGNTALTGKNNSSHKIPSITTAKTLGSMSNEWGYYATLGDTEASYNPSTSFKAMTTSQQSVGTGGATSSSVTRKLTLFYGARVTSSAVEDFYGNTVTLSVVAQPRTVTTTVTKFNGITTMQEMTSTICKNAAENDTARLRDTRDNKYYWVTKLLDGNCWMSQNLAFDISTTNVTATRSDVTSNWTSNSAYPPKTTATSITTNNTTETDTQSWNLGDYVVIDPTAIKTCDSSNKGLSACTGQFVDVSGKTPSSEPNFYQKNGATYTSTEYDAHYLAGNYYQWNAATAGTGGTITNANASGSICPKNWKLPNNGTGTEQLKKGSFNYMLLQYGLAYEGGGTYRSTVGTSSINSNTYNIALSPLFFMRNGDVFSPHGQLHFAGSSGTYQSSRAGSDAASMYILSFSNSVSPNGSTNSRANGWPLRCLVPTS